MQFPADLAATCGYHQHRACSRSSPDHNATPMPCDLMSRSDKTKPWPSLGCRLRSSKLLALRHLKAPQDSVPASASRQASHLLQSRQAGSRCQTRCAALCRRSWAGMQAPQLHCHCPASWLPCPATGACKHAAGEDNRAIHHDTGTTAVHQCRSYASHPVGDAGDHRDHCPGPDSEQSNKTGMAQPWTVRHRWGAPRRGTGCACRC